MTNDKQKIDPWHYPRNALATRYLEIFKIGLMTARGIFAKRRMGKTEFLTKDLLPLAKKSGYLVAYANLWELDKKSPENVLAQAILDAIEPNRIAKLVQHLNPTLKKIKASGKLAVVGEVTGEVEFFDQDASVNSSPIYIALRNFDNTGKKLLLAIDEAQVLASNEHSGFSHALRAALDVRKDTIKVIFAGSSEQTLRKMFGRSSEPFYNWAPLEPFDLLGEDFVKSMVRKVNQLSQFPLDEKDALRAFTELHSTPLFFRKYLERYLSYADLGSEEALNNTKTVVINETNYINDWKTLLPADKEILQMIAEGVPDLHGESSRLRLGMALGLDKPVSMNTPRQSLQRLINDSIIARIDHGVYRFEDDAFQQWILNDDRDGDGGGGGASGGPPVKP